nr:hypothetical protein [Citrobacter braakii]
MKDHRDTQTGNLLATPNAIRQARFADAQRKLGRKARKIWATDDETEADLVCRLLLEKKKKKAV